MYVSAYFVRNGDRYFINNDRGELIIAKLSPRGYEEVSRSQLITPTHPQIRRRAAGLVAHWTQPAYANKHLITRKRQRRSSAWKSCQGMTRYRSGQFRGQVVALLRRHREWRWRLRRRR